MKLRAYLDQHELTATAFAARVGVTHAAIVRYMNLTRRPAWAVMDRISAETGGAVQPSDFLNGGDPPPADPDQQRVA